MSREERDAAKTVRGVDHGGGRDDRDRDGGSRGGDGRGGGSANTASVKPMKLLPVDEMVDSGGVEKDGKKRKEAANVTGSGEAEQKPTKSILPVDEMVDSDGVEKDGPRRSRSPMAEGPPWLCSCGTKNSRDDRQCAQCGSAHPEKRPEISLLFRKIQWRAGDWTCQCGEINFATREKCFRCNELKATSKRTLDPTKLNDWICTCGNFNYAGRMVCYKCAEPYKDDENVNVTTSAGMSSTSSDVKKFGKKKKEDANVTASKNEKGNQKPLLAEGRLRGKITSLFYGKRPWGFLRDQNKVERIWHSADITASIKPFKTVEVGEIVEFELIEIDGKKQVGKLSAPGGGPVKGADKRVRPPF